LAVCLLLEIMSFTGQDIAGLYHQLAALYGNSFYTRIDMPVTEDAKENIKKLKAENFAALKEIAGEKVLNVRDSDGLKIYLENSWILVRPSGTEAIVKFYVETFKSQEHLDLLIKEGGKVFNI
jgi:phosphoglucomutase